MVWKIFIVNKLNSILNFKVKLQFRDLANVSTGDPATFIHTVLGGHFKNHNITEFSEELKRCDRIMGAASCR
jgi:hypothetical protein